MSHADHSQQSIPDRDGAAEPNPSAGLSGARGAPGEFSTRACYGVAGAGPTPVIVRAWRTWRGRIRHTAVTPADAEAWRRWLLDAGRPGAPAVGCVTAQESLTLWLQAPFASISKAEKVLPSLLDVQLPFPLESCHYRIVDIRRMPDGTTHALAVAARLEHLRARLELCRAQRWDPVLLDHEGLALWTQSRDECPLPPAARRIVLHADLDHVTLVIGQGDRYGNAHSVQANPPAEPADLPAVLDGLVGRLRRILRAEIRDTAANHWMAGGAGARNGPLINGLHQALAGEWPGPLTIHREPETFLVRALGIRALTRGPLRCNLRTHELAHPVLLRHIRARKLTTACLFLAAGLFLCGINAAWSLLAARREAVLQQAVSQVAAELAPGVRMPHGQEVREAKKSAAQRLERIAPFLEAFEASPAGALADLIRAGTGQGVAYETLTFQRAGFALAGAGDDWDQCESLAKRLRALGYAVKLERQESPAGGQARFIIKGEKQPQGKPGPGGESNEQQARLGGPRRSDDDVRPQP